MTVRELDELLANLDLGAPVTLEDLAGIKSVIDQRKPAGIVSESILRGDYVEVCVGMHEAAVRRWYSLAKREWLRTDPFSDRA